MQKLILDLDSTLCDFLTPWFHWLVDKGITETLHIPEEVLSYDFFQKKYGKIANEYFLQNPFETYSKIKPIPGAKEFIDWTVEKYDTIILTHSSKKETQLAKIEWCMEYLGIQSHQIKFFSDMEEKAKDTHNAILVDDYPLHIIKHISQNNQPGILFNYQGKNGYGYFYHYENLWESERRPSLDNLYSAADFKSIINILTYIKDWT